MLDELVISNAKKLGQFDYRTLMAMRAENDYHRSDVDYLAALKRRMATIKARAILATQPF